MVRDFSLLAIERIAKKAGCERISSQALITLKETLLEVAENISRDAIKFAAHAKRKTVKKDDIILASRGYEKI